MVGVAVECRMGNQLFQYAFIKALSKQLNTSFFLIDSREPFIAATYFDIEGYHPLTNLLRRIFFKVVKGPRFKNQSSRTIDNYNENEFITLTDYTIYSGYFQSALFFKNIDTDISSFIRVKKKYKNQFYQQYGNTFAGNRIIAVHIRRGDYQHLSNWWAQNLGSNNLTLPVNYFLNAIEQVEGYEQCRIIFLSDDIDFAQSHFSHLPNAEFADNDMIIDFQIMMNADVCILSNSSFSWWAAYLNIKTHKQIFCPEYWLGFLIKKEYPHHIIPSNWIPLSPLQPSDL